MPSEGQVGQYSMNVTDGATGFVAYYPYSEDVRIDGTTVNASVPVNQTVEGNYSSRVAKSSSSVLFFNNLTGRLGFEVEMDGVKKVTLKSSVPVAGDISVDFSGSIPVVTAAATEVTPETFREGRRTVSPSPPDILGTARCPCLTERQSSHITPPRICLLAPGPHCRWVR